MTLSNAELRKALSDIFYKAGLEHLIQDEPNDGFCETCQTMAKPLCYATNAMLTVASQDITKLFQAREQKLLTELYEQRWIVSLELGVSKAVISANDIKERLQNKTNDGEK